MKSGFKIGDEVKVTVGKFAGKEDVVEFIDKKTKRVRLKGLKKFKDKGKKEHHGTFAVSSLLSLRPSAPTKEIQAKTTPEPQAKAE
jgi:ribosomal protein L24